MLLFGDGIPTEGRENHNKVLFCQSSHLRQTFMMQDQASSRKTSEESSGSAADLARAVDRLSGLISDRLAPAIEELTRALGRLDPLVSSSKRIAEVAPGDNVRAEIQISIRENRWAEATQLLDRLERTEDLSLLELEDLRSTVASGRGRAIQALRSRLDASRQVNDTDSVILLQEELARLLPEDERRELEAGVASWLLSQIQRRMRSGTVAADVVELAAQVAERFGHTREGASLRASLPVLRRSAGQCPKCGQPFVGLEKACPKCLRQPTLAVAAATEAAGGGEAAPEQESESQSDEGSETS